MNTTTIILLHLWILASQAFYMYLSNKTQLKAHRYLYLIAAPIVAAFPVILHSQSPRSYNIYEYAIVFCIIFAAVADASIAAIYNRENLTDETGRSLTYSYLLICTVIAFCGSADVIVKAVTAFLLAGSILAFILVKKHSAMELIKSIPLALIPVLCSWAYLRLGA